jgi:hypothetical protein
MFNGVGYTDIGSIVNLVLFDQCKFEVYFAQTRTLKQLL